MRQTRVTVWLAIGIVAAGASSWAAAQSTARPDLKVGDEWKVRVHVQGVASGNADYEELRMVKEAGEAGYTIAATRPSDGTDRSYKLTPDLNAMSGTQETKWLQWPLEPGRHWQFDLPTPNGLAVTWSGKVQGWEDVEVPAGKFKALRIVFDRSGPVRGSAGETVWFAPDAKAVVKRISVRPAAERSTTTTTVELVSYKIK